MRKERMVMNALNPQGEVRFGEIVVMGDETVEESGFRRDEANHYRVHPSHIAALQRYVDNQKRQMAESVKDFRQQISGLDRRWEHQSQQSFNEIMRQLQLDTQQRLANDGPGAYTGRMGIAGEDYRPNTLDGLFGKL